MKRRRRPARRCEPRARRCPGSVRRRARCATRTRCRSSVLRHALPSRTSRRCRRAARPPSRRARRRRPRSRAPTPPAAARRRRSGRRPRPRRAKNGRMRSTTPGVGSPCSCTTSSAGSPRPVATRLDARAARTRRRSCARPRAAREHRGRCAGVEPPRALRRRSTPTYAAPNEAAYAASSSRVSPQNLTSTATASPRDAGERAHRRRGIGAPRRCSTRRAPRRRPAPATRSTSAARATPLSAIAMPVGGISGEQPRRHRGLDDERLEIAAVHADHGVARRRGASSSSASLRTSTSSSMPTATRSVRQLAQRDPAPSARAMSSTADAPAARASSTERVHVEVLLERAAPTSRDAPSARSSSDAAELGGLGEDRERRRAAARVGRRLGAGIDRRR